MKKRIFLGLVTFAMMMVSATAIAGSEFWNVGAAGDHEGKPCHHVDAGRRARCSCSSCYGNNWGNYYCTRCGHSVKEHY